MDPFRIDAQAVLSMNSNTTDDHSLPEEEEPFREDDLEVNSIAGKRVALLGRFGGMNQREAGLVLRSYDAIIVPSNANAIDWVVVGANESPLTEAELIGRRLFDRTAAGEVEILHETELWQRLGLTDGLSNSRQYYTPVMLAQLLGVSVRVIRRWHRRGLIRPVHSLHRLPYFDFQEVTMAKRLAQWIGSGANPQAIEQRLVELVEVLPDIQRPLDQLSILVEGKQVLLRSGEGLLEPGGQMRFDFDAEDANETSLRIVDHSEMVYSMIDQREQEVEEEPLLDQVFACEDAGDFQTAIDTLHILLGRDGPQADLCFQLGELLYRVGEISAARERYFMAIELDADFVEARCSLGVVLFEEGKFELAIAALRGALTLHEDYPDVHYYLARALDDAAHAVEAEYHWTRFLKLAPDSPWASEARCRLGD